MQPVINTEKHYVQNSLFTVASGAIVNVTLVNAAAVPTGANQVREGAKISAVYLEYWLQTDDASAGTTIVTLEKISSGAGNMTAANSALLNDYANKKNVFYTHMGLTPNNVTYPMAAVKGWFKIPKSKQRIGLGDKIKLNFHGQSNGISVCGFSIFKEQY